MDFKKMCMTLAIIIILINVGFTSFRSGLEGADEHLPKQNLIGYDYDQALDDVNTTVNKLSESSANSDFLGIVVFGIGAMSVILGVLANLIISTLTGYYTLMNYFAGMIEPSGSGGIHLLFSGIGLVMSIFSIYGLYDLLKDILGRN